MKYMKLLACPIVLGALAFGLVGCNTSKKAEVPQEATTEQYHIVEDDGLQTFSHRGVMFVEDNKISVEKEDDSFLFRNQSNQIVEAAELVFSDGEKELFYDFEYLLPGQQVSVPEMSGNTPEEDAVINFVEGDIQYTDYDSKVGESLSLKTAQKGVKIENLTDETIPMVKIVYRNRAERGVYQGGSVQFVMAENIKAKGTKEVTLPGWSKKSEVIYVQILSE